MALTTSIITGRLAMPDDAAPKASELIFSLSGLDTEGADILPPAALVRRVMLENGEIPAGFSLWRNTEGYRGTHYAVTARWISQERSRRGRYDFELPLGNIQVGDEPEYTLAELLNSGVDPATPSYWMSISQEDYEKFEEWRNDTVAAAAQAEAFGTIYTQTDAELASMTIPAPVTIMQRMPAVGGQVAPANIVTRWRRTDDPGPQPYYTTAGGVQWVVAEFTQAEMLSILTSAVEAIYDNPVFTGQARLANGTAGAPSLTFSSDTNTGLYRHAADQIGFATNGVQRMVLGTAGFSVNVPISGLAVTQTATDATGGRLTKVNDYGLPVAILLTAGDNLDNIVASGFYYNPTAGNTPGNNYPLSSAGSLIVARRSGSAGIQMFTSYAGGSGGAANVRMFTRSYGAAGWSPWVEVFHQGTIVGTVSQAGGVPTGKVIQPNSNSNGRSERLASGSQRVWRADLEVASATIAAGSRFRSADVTWTFPAAFLSGENPAVTASVVDPDCDVRLVSVSPTQAVFRVIADVSKSDPLVIHARAEGRWSDMT